MVREIDDSLFRTKAWLTLEKELGSAEMYYAYIMHIFNYRTNEKIAAILPKPKTQLVVTFQHIFDDAYAIYPRKMGKTIGMKRLKSLIKTEEKALLFKRACSNYAVAMAGTEQKYILLFSSFINRYEDYLEVNAPKILTIEEISDYNKL